ncbi:hypothetical protein [Bacteroides thetaiotaomicron]|nr:hypothetical protein [Bacteroides thetaiotaomicron]MCS2520634.1 hypothetical protein [Bacteroides thetaiotaomicron]MDC2250209.1 hypothetical protein [Bacteroides thetaiotaomicron]MDC2269939.1 hypothetical protein [Bacteroides thetaiotaomicron]
MKLKFPLLETRVSSAWNRWFRHMETNGPTHDRRQSPVDIAAL